jgi:glycosyltransferase involved in cell wall biosynthesis
VIWSRKPRFEMDYPKITIVTCSYNQGRFLEATIRSVIDQGYPGLEYIIMDGGSQDNSVEIIRKYEKHLTYWVSERDDGQSDALAKGFERSTGDILGWLCSDDLLEKGALLEVGQYFMENRSADVVFGDTIFIDAAGSVFRRYKTLPFQRWLMLNTYNYIPQPSTFWRRELYFRVGGLDRSMHMGMDPDLWMRFASVSRLYHVRRYWSRMRFYPEIKSLVLKHETRLARRRLEDTYIGKRSLVRRSVAMAAAKMVRIAWKIKLGCYW